MGTLISHGVLHCSSPSRYTVAPSTLDTTKPRVIGYVRSFAGGGVDFALRVVSVRARYRLLVRRSRLDCLERWVGSRTGGWAAGKQRSNRDQVGTATKHSSVYALSDLRSRERLSVACEAEVRVLLRTHALRSPYRGTSLSPAFLIPKTGPMAAV